jgi:rhodanese-related sulfurtransferase
VEPAPQLVNGSADGLTEISWQELYRRLGDSSLQIVDVLLAEAYVSGHIPGAISLPLDEVNSRAREVIPDRDAEIAIYCASST